MPILMAKGDSIVRVDAATIRVTRTSPLTGQRNTRDLPVTEGEWAAYRGGALIQDAMSGLAADQREFLMTGYTAEDWAALFPPEEGEEDA